MDPIQSAKRIHDILIRNITYIHNDDYLHHTIIGPLIEKHAVCDGFSRLYKYLLNKLNIDCIVVRGRGFNNTLTNSENHLWNMINISGKWYHVDVTYDKTLSLSDYIRYDYFLVDDKTISIDHYYNHRDTPNAYDMSEYIYSDKKVTHNKTELSNNLYDEISLGNSDFIICIDQECLIDDIASVIESCLSYLSGRINNYHSFSFNINQTRKIVHIRLK